MSVETSRWLISVYFFYFFPEFDSVISGITYLVRNNSVLIILNWVVILILLYEFICKKVNSCIT